jgi:aspartate dehydrogenase
MTGPDPHHRTGMRRVALVGLGGIARSVLGLIAARPEAGVRCVGVLVRPERRAEAQAWLGERAPAVAEPAALLALQPSVIAECAGQQALQNHGEALLAGAADLVALSSGAFADRPFEAAMRAAAERRRRRIVIPAGAIGGIDALLAARHGGLAEVTYVGRKPPAAWRGTPAEQAIDLDALTAPAIFYRGTARHAATAFPKNANVTATIALAGSGFDQTQVCLVADPGAAANVHRLEYSGGFGQASFEIVGCPSPDNPRTSLITALSLWQTLLDGSGIAVGGSLPGVT